MARPPRLFIAAYLAGIPAIVLLSTSDSIPPGWKSVVMGVALLLIWGAISAVFLGTFLAPFVLFWKAARASDAELQKEAGPTPSSLRIEPPAGRLAPAAPPPEPKVKYFLTSPAWLLSGLGLIGGAGLLAAFAYGRADLQTAFGSMLFVGTVGWFLKTNAPS